MYCEKCHTKNSKKANYCCKCKHKFTDEEKKRASEQGLVPFLKRMKELVGYYKLDFIFESKIFRALAIVAIIGFGLYNYWMMGSNIKILYSDSYSTQYNEELDAYYIMVDKDAYHNNGDQVQVYFYIPGRMERLQMNLYEKDGDIIEEKEISRKDDIILKANTNANHYYLLANKDDLEDSLKIYVYLY